MRDDQPATGAPVEDEGETHRRDDFLSVLDIARSVITRVGRGIAEYPYVLLADGNAQIGAPRSEVGEVLQHLGGRRPNGRENRSPEYCIFRIERRVQSLQVFYSHGAIIYAGFTLTALICRDPNCETGQCVLKERAGGQRPGRP